MLETFTAATFEPLRGERFRVPLEDALELELAEVNVLGEEAGGSREPFSLVFRGPLDRLLPQLIYPLEHDALGAFALFLVPIGPDAEGHLYEAVFT